MRRLARSHGNALRETQDAARKPAAWAAPCRADAHPFDKEGPPAYTSGMDRGNMLGKDAWRIEDRATREDERISIIKRTVHAIGFVGLNGDCDGDRKSRDKMSRMMR